MLAHIAGLPVEELLPYAYGVTGLGTAVHMARRRIRRRRRSPKRVGATPTQMKRGG